MWHRDHVANSESESEWLGLKHLAVVGNNLILDGVPDELSSTIRLWRRDGNNLLCRFADISWESRGAAITDEDVKAIVVQDVSEPSRLQFVVTNIDIHHVVGLAHWEAVDESSVTVWALSDSRLVFSST